jgi:cell division protein FtsB
MVVRTRLRAILGPLAFYCVAGAVSAYFVWTANTGERGLKAKLEYKQQIAGLRLQLAGLQDQKAQWVHRVALMRSESVDRDLAEEQARAKLDYVDPHDVMIFEGSRRAQ